MKNEIIQNGDPRLRDLSVEITPQEFGNAPLLKLVEKMSKALAECKDGVALAAPQIGVSKRLFVVSPKAFKENEWQHEHLVYINPKIVKRSSKKLEMEEGCLSVRNTYGLIKRYDKVTVEALDEHGVRFSRGGAGLLAEIFQHEIDHLDGVLFIDKAKDLKEILPDEHE